MKTPKTKRNKENREKRKELFNQGVDDVNKKINLLIDLKTDLKHLDQV